MGRQLPSFSAAFMEHITFYVQPSKPGVQFYTLWMLQMKMKSSGAVVIRTHSLLLA